MEINTQSSFNNKLYLLVLLAGAVTIFAFAPFQYYPIAWLTPAVLFYALTKAVTKRQYFKLSFIYGIGLFGAGASWPFYSMYFFAHAPLALAILGTALFDVSVAFLTLGLFGLLASLFRTKPLSIKLIIIYPAAWVLLEWWKSWFLTGFPWLNIGASQIDSIFSSYAPITGVLGVSWAVVLLSGATLNLFLRDKESETRLTNSVFSIAVILLVSIFAYFLGSVNWTQKTGEPITVSVLQSNITQLDKLNSANLRPSINLYKSMTEESKDSDLIVWPETAVFDAFGSHMDSLILPLQQGLKGTSKTIMMGGFHINENNQVENSILSLSSERRDIYSKRHLVPFGEYIPLIDYVKWLGDWIPRSNLHAGEGNGTLDIAGQTAQMSICYEDAFGEEMIKSLPQSTLLINVTHDGWFTGSFEPEQHMQIARMRSLEMGRYMVRATTSGPSGIIDEKGRIVATAPIYTKKAITHTVQPYRGSTPYVRWGNWFIVSILSVILLIGFFWKREKYK